MNHKDLVSICIITYNSSRYVMETLESIKMQTYQNIELIISDDCSTDDTIELCDNWLKENKERFIKTELVTVIKNTGVSPNLKRGLLRCNGTFIKSLAGDDCLEPNAIEEFVSFSKDKNIDVCLADISYIGQDSKVLDHRLSGVYSTYLDNLDESYEFQKKTISATLFIPGPPVFFSKRAFEAIKDNAFEYPFADEWPLFFFLIHAGFRLYPLRKRLIRYRVHNSLCRGDVNGLIDKRVFYSMKSFFKKEISTELIRQHRYLEWWDMTLSYFVQNKMYSNKKTLCKFLKLLSPLYCKRRFLKVD